MESASQEELFPEKKLPEIIVSPGTAGINEAIEKLENMYVKSIYPENNNGNN